MVREDLKTKGVEMSFFSTWAKIMVRYLWILAIALIACLIIMAILRTADLPTRWVPTVIAIATGVFICLQKNK